jgi:ferredoxin
MVDKLQGTGQDRLKVHFVRPKGAISRRELLKMAIPRYEVVPFIKAELCPGEEACGICMAAVCPHNAIKAEADEVTIDTALCSGCGACVDSCPHRAIVYPPFNPEELDKELERLLIPGAKPGVIALICQSCFPVSDGDDKIQPYCHSDVGILKIPCLAMASPWLIMRAFDRGARGLALISRRENCQAGPDPSSWQGNVDFVRGLLRCWGIDPERIRLINITEGDIAGELDRFVQRTAGLKPTPFEGSEPAVLSTDGLMLPALIKAMASKIGTPPAGPVIEGLVPFGNLELDGSRCTGCGLCAVDCPTGALTVDSIKGEGYRLLFRHDICIACGRCSKVCPEQCLRLERILELSAINNAAGVLFEDEVARCRECGRIIGTRAMINNLQFKLKGMDSAIVSQLELCTVCKKKQVNLSIPVPGSIPR